MATQSASSPASRTNNASTKVAAPSSKPTIGRQVEQPLVGKIGKDMGAMPGSKGKGQAVKTAPSNPIAGAKSAQPGNTSMGNGSVIAGII